MSSAKHMKTTTPILVSEYTRRALLGRYALCRLNCTIKCTSNGCLMEMLNDDVDQFLMLIETETS